MDFMEFTGRLHTHVVRKHWLCEIWDLSFELKIGVKTGHV